MATSKGSSHKRAVVTTMVIHMDNPTIRQIDFCCLENFSKQQD